MCPSRISFAEVVLTTKDFSLIDCDKAFRVGCELQKLARILEDVNETDVVSFAVHETTCTVEVTVHSAATQDETTVKEIDCDDDVYALAVPRTPYSATVSMPQSLFRDIVTTLEGDTCEIGITQTGILFRSDKGSLSILKTNDVQVAFKVKKTVKLGSDLCRLRAFANLDSIASSTVHLSLLPDFPLRLQFSTATSQYTTYLSLYLVPYVDKDEDCDTPITAEEELELSHRIRSSKKVTISSETKTANTHATAKRRRTPSTDRKRPPRKNRAPRSKKPKKCTKCGTIKASEEFFDAELRKTKFAKCVDCTLVSCEQNMFVSYIHEMVRARRHELADEEEDGNTERSEIQALHSLGCERYECPIFFGNKNDNIVTSLQASFNPAFPDVTTLFGSYDIVYAFSDCASVVDGKPRYKQRTVHGLLNLTYRHLASTGSNELYGVVEMDRAIQNYVEPRGGSFSFAQVMDDDSSPFLNCL